MCDYSLTNVRSRPARVGDKLYGARFWYRNPRILRPGRSGHRSVSVARN